MDSKPKKKSDFINYIKKTWQLYVMLLLPITFFLLFKYLPIMNTRIAFVDYNPFLGMKGSDWNNFAHFKELFSQTLFIRALRNTFMLNILDLLFSFPMPIIVAILLNELFSDRIKKYTQTLIYIPHFLSWVIIAGMVMQIFNSTGIINTILQMFGEEKINFLTNKWSWLAVYIGVGVWQSVGYGTIIYLAALTNIDPSLYEAAYVDGAGRFRRIISITLPCIKGTVVMMLILSMGKLMNISFDRPYLMGNPIVMEFSDVISTYVYRVGIESSRFDYATAVGLFQSLVAFVLIISVNTIVKKMGEEGIL